MYAIEHLRGNAILEATHENATCSEDEIAAQVAAHWRRWTTEEKLGASTEYVARFKRFLPEDVNRQARLAVIGQLVRNSNAGRLMPSMASKRLAA